MYNHSLLFLQIEIIIINMNKMIQTKSALMLHNRNIVLNVFRSTNKLTIAEIVRRTKLSNNTAIKVVEYYIAIGLILNIGKGESTYDGGKKPNIYQFNPKANFAIGMHFAADGYLQGVLTDLKGTIIEKIKKKMSWNISIDKVTIWRYSIE